jgi:hypothetical protein
MDSMAVLVEDRPQPLRTIVAIAASANASTKSPDPSSIGIDEVIVCTIAGDVLVAKFASPE